MYHCWSRFSHVPSWSPKRVEGAANGSVALEPHSNARSLCSAVRWTRFASVVRAFRQASFEDHAPVRTSATDASKDAVPTFLSSRRAVVERAGDKRERPQVVPPCPSSPPSKAEFKKIFSKRRLARARCLNVRPVACGAKIISFWRFSPLFSFRFCHSENIRKSWPCGHHL